MLNNKILQKLLAIVLIFTLTFANFAFVTKSYASTLAEVLFGQDFEATHKNVEFEAYFGTEEDKSASVISDVNNQELAINAKLNIKESGYLKDAQIEISKGYEGESFNFKLKEIEELPEYVQSIEDNVLKLQQIDSLSNGINLSLPIEFKYEKYYDEENLSKDFFVTLTGTYVDNEGKEQEISMDTELNISWKDEREVRVESNATKYIDFGRGVILQTIVKLDSTTERNTLPVKESEITIDIPKIGETAPSNIDVVVNSTLATNGRKVGETIFTQDNWFYNQEENKLTIKAINEKRTVLVNEFEDEFLQEAENAVVEDERYYNMSGVDEYLVTYTFDNMQIAEEPLNINTNIETKLTTFSGVENEENINIVTTNQDFEYALEGKVGDIVSLNIDNQSKEIQKSYLYANYNNNGKYEIELDSKTMINVSYKEIVETLNIEDVQNLYVDKSGNVIENNDIYYKNIAISRDNFIEILGENGEIKILDLAGNILGVLNSQSEVNEEGNIVIGFVERYAKLNFEITKPVAEGNLVISNVKAIGNVSLDKLTLANISNIKTQSIIKAKYAYVEEKVEVETVETITSLLDATTKATLVMDRNNLSTITTNEDVEIRIELNNAVETSDIYGHSVFEIELPESVESTEITNYSLLYAEGLEITTIETLDRIIRITIDGKQDGINSGVLTNGTNIVLNANIKVNLFTPAKLEVMKLRYTNDEATNYVSNGYAELPVEYSAPTGLVTVNTTYNYNNKGSRITSVRQGMKNDLIEIYSESKIATLELIIMNNNSNTVSDVAILGRVPFKGVKDMITGDDLRTTLDLKMLNGIVQDGLNNQEFIVYYSTNGEATKDLEDGNNGWTATPQNYDGIKSYLIVPTDENYVMNPADVLRFSYEYEIPADLSHNQNIYGTFATYYTNNSEVAITEEISVPDLVGLTTGAGPELALELTANKNQVKEFEEIEVKIVATNTGINKAQEVNVEFKVPEYTTYVTSNMITEGGVINVENGIVRATMVELLENQTLEFTVVLKVDEVVSSTGYTEIVISGDMEEPEEYTEIPQEYIEEIKEVKEDAANNIKLLANVTALDFATILTAEKDISTVEAKIGITESNRSDIDAELGVQLPGCEVEFNLVVTNLTDEQINNVIVTKELPAELSYKNAYVMEFEEDGVTPRQGTQAIYDESTRTIQWQLGDLAAEDMKQLVLTVTVNELSEDLTKTEVRTLSKVSGEGTEVYESNSLVVYIGRPQLEINQTTENTDTYIKEGDAIKYIYTVKNTGGAVATRVKLKDVIPDGIKVMKVSYSLDGKAAQKISSYKDDVTIVTNMAPGSELLVNIEAVASNLEGVQEKTITNYATVSGKDVEEEQSNSITHIVEADENSIIEGETYYSSSTQPITSDKNIVKTYKLTGTAWLDLDENGMRNDGEELLAGISVKLVNSDTGIITKAATTDTNGTYTFAGVENGNYLVIFDYDTVKYTVTTYQKEGVDGNINSDVVTAKLEQNGKTRNGAITDVVTIANGSVSGIDIGLILADKFDLELTKTITKVITQTANKTTTDNYDHIDMAKTEIAAKHLVGSTVYVEYAMTVTNKGDISGYAKKIVDYLPEGMTFNSSLEENVNWYTGTDGNLYSEQLADIQLTPGESKTIKLVLSRQMTEENTNIVNNLAEIYEDYNIYGVSDSTSTPSNKAQGENDLGSADMVIMIKTGEAFIHISVIITSLLLGSVVVFITYNGIVLRRKKGGV